MKLHTLTLLITTAFTFNLRADLPELSLDMDDGTGDSAPLMEDQVSSPSFALGEETTGPALALQMPTSGPGAYQAVDRGRDFVRYERAVSTTNRAGRVLVHTNSYIQLESGGRYWLNNQWKPSREEIDIVANGAVARRTAHKVAFAPNINSPISVEVLTPDNKRLKLRPLGIAYYDFHARTNVLIAELKDSNGQLVGTNQVIYPDAFTDFQADVRYTLSKSGLEQDVILRQRPALPEEYGLNPTTTRLLVLTEFIDPPIDAQPVRQIRRGWIRATVDKAVNFGAMKIGQGTAFNPDTDLQRNQGIPVQKHWTVLEGRTFLIEEISFPRLTPHLRNLQSSVSPSADTKALLARHPPSKELLLPPVRLATVSPKSAIQIAAAPPPQQGLVLDFPLNTTQDDVVLKGDTTYEVSGHVVLGGVTTIEGGTVIKYDDGARLTLGAVRCKTGPYRPAIFTALDDQTVGNSISDGELSGIYADCALSLGLGGDLSYVNIRYATNAIYCANNEYSVSHSQILHCQVGFHNESAIFTNCNILLYQVQTNFLGSHFHGRIEHLTSDQSTVLAHDWDYHEDYGCPGVHSSTLALVNSLTAAITNGYASGLPLDAISCDHVLDFPSRDGVFQTVGAGAHYLVEGSTNRLAGTTNISPALLADLRVKTTYPPIIHSNVTISTDLTLGPQAQRETGLPSLGYAYDALDYIISQAWITNGTVAVQPGTGLGVYPTSYGYAMSLSGAADLQCIGSPNAPIHIAQLNTVQEASLPIRNTFFISSLMTFGGQPQARFEFTGWHALGNWPQHFFGYDSARAVAFKNCQFFSGAFLSYVPPLSITNCLFDRVSLDFDDCGTEAGFQLAFFNALFRGGSCGLSRCYDQDWIFKDNAFDRTALGTYSAPTIYDYNAYIAMTNYLGGALQTNDITLTNLAWQNGPLGNYYQPTNSLLLNAGNTTADQVGLYHYTVLTNQVKEATNTVSIGLHYPAVTLPLIATQPVDQPVIQGATATFYVLVTNTLLPSYQWTFRGTAVPGATTSALNITNAQPFNEGVYAVLITNPAGSVASSNALLTCVPASWLVQYFGTDYQTNASAAWDADPDNDGLPNWREYQVGTNPLNPDSDYDGRSDGQEITDGTNPLLPESALPTLLSHWRFDDTNSWVGEQGQLPTSALNVAGLVGVMTNAVLLHGPAPTLLKYPVTKPDGRAAITLSQGTIRFWFKPDWSSTKVGGTGPGCVANLIEVGTYSPVPSNGWWGLFLHSDGDHIVFATATNGTLVTNLCAAITWNSNEWHNVALTYNPTNSVLYLDFNAITNGAGITCYPNADERAVSGLRIGSDRDGNNQAKGAFDELATFNYPLDSQEIIYDPSIIRPQGACVRNWVWSYSPLDLYCQFRSPEPSSLGESMQIAGSVNAPTWLIFYGIDQNCCYPPPCNQTVYERVTTTVSWYTTPGSSQPASGVATAQGSFIPNISFIPTRSGTVYISVTAVSAPGPVPVPAVFQHITVPFAVFPQKRLAHWSFDYHLVGDDGQMPVVANLVSRVPTPFRNGVAFDNPSASIELTYPTFQADQIPYFDGSVNTSAYGTPNIRRNCGTIRFWYKPSWSSPNGPANDGILLDMLSGWILRLTSNGSVLRLDNGGNPASVAVSQTVNWTAGHWYQITVTYSGTRSSLHVKEPNGQQLVADGSGVAGLAFGYGASFRIGSDGTTQHQVQGVIDELETFNYELTAGQVLADYNAACALDSDGDGLANVQEWALGTDPYDPDTDSNGVLDGQDPTHPPNPGDTTPPQIQLLEPANATQIP